MAAQNVQVEIISTGLWQQLDARDSLGVWGGREILTGSAGGGPLKVRFTPAADKAGAYVYTCYGATIALLTANEGQVHKCRLLTNWPDVDEDVGVQGFATLQMTGTTGSANFTAPFEGSNPVLVLPNHRFILLFDPRPVAGAFDIVELETDRSVDLATYAFEAWGYFWDRGVLQAPGGPRHPGSA